MRKTFSVMSVLLLAACVSPPPASNDAPAAEATAETTIETMSRDSMTEDMASTTETVAEEAAPEAAYDAASMDDLNSRRAQPGSAREYINRYRGTTPAEVMAK